jgi:hypothetical protein
VNSGKPWHRLQSSLCLLGVAFLLLAVGEPCAAQGSYIEGISEITTDGTNVYTWSETYVTPDLALYYGAYVEGYLWKYQNQAWTQIADGYASESPYFNDAYGGMEALLSSGAQYEIVSNHGVWAYWTYEDPGTGETYYYNPDSFTSSSGDLGGGTDFMPNQGGPLYSVAELIYLGSTDALLSLTSISSLSPSSAAVGTSGTIEVEGTGLFDTCTGVTTASITGSGVTLTVDSVSSDGTQATLGYSIATNASTGSQTLTVSTCMGQGQAGFTVGDPTPVITGVNPNNFPAGATTPFTISGSGFGNAPTLTVTGNGVISYPISSSTDNTINATVTIAANAPSGLATITVTSTGYLGQGFVSTGGSGGSTNSATAKASIAAAQGAAPKIVWGPDTGGGSNCGGSNITSKSVVVGQQIAFTACFSPPQGATITSETWSPSIPAGTVVSGYNAWTTEGCVVAFGQSTCGTPGSTGVVCGSSNYCDFPTFYWVDTGGNGSTFTVSYTYTLNGSAYSGSAQIMFTVTGLSELDVETYPDPDTLAPVGVQPSSPVPYLQLGTANPNNLATFGVVLSASANLPSGQGWWEWVQLISAYHVQVIYSAGRFSCLPKGWNGKPTSGTPILDTTYPYSSAATTSSNATDDSPRIPLGGETGITFHAWTYLMWDPAIPPIGQETCTPASVGANGVPAPSTCSSIPVPLGHIDWQWSGDAINTLSAATGDNNTTGHLLCGPTSVTKFVLDDSFPTWTNAVMSGQSLSQAFTCTRE